ncbi:MAG: 2-amino-4-hydroxy-6-hydroxymethyldihydropteridine diphosphokinase [Gallionellales bacterium GWA2_60_142]|jgi:2-amino-4-hydroxy-6-hydroxymethyldihydropteridine diphosphokinase|nr:MAG: 2-amino-4-hydroxy-6-hydroxymethyldihydropteridine diphosphokinase [Gallionellales bacterium GWA2_60_142]HCI14397.1 2-amino-4-hydroxy-6-hydroxymethyldihydropteridine diphosphokinase [Gallionellaceae bacterium]
MLHTAFIGLGSNLEDPRSQLQRAFADLDALPDTRLVARSSLYRSAPVGYLDQPDFVNAVAQLETSIAPHDLLNSLLDIEHRHGRERTFRNAPRTLDLDVLLYDELQLHEHGLTIPHPQMHLRAFVLQPLLELAPDCAIPGVGSAAQALEGCADQSLERMQDAAG